MTNLGSILKSRDINLSGKVHIVKAMIFQVVMYGCEAWTIERRSTEELVLLNYGAREDSWEPLDSREIKSVQSIPKEINLEYSLKGLMLKLKL